MKHNALSCYFLCFILSLALAPAAALAQKPPVTAEELEQVLARPVPDETKSMEIAVWLVAEKRDLSDEARIAALKALETKGAMVIYALAPYLMDHGEADAVFQRFWEIVLNPKPPYGRWIAALSLLSMRTDQAELFRQRQAAIAQARDTVIRNAAKANQDVQDEFIHVLMRFPDEYAQRLVLESRSGVLVVAGGMESKVEEVQRDSVTLLLSTPFSMIPSSAIPSLAKAVEAGDPELVPRANYVLQQMVGSVKPRDAEWQALCKRLTDPKEMAGFAMARLGDRRLSSDTIRPIAQLALSAASDVGENAYEDTCSRLLDMAASPEFEGDDGQVLREVVAEGQCSIKFSQKSYEKIRDVCIASLRSKSGDQRRNGTSIGLFLIKVPAEDRQVEACLRQLLTDPTAQFLSRAQAAFALWPVARGNRGMALEVLGVLTQVEQVVPGSRSASILRSVLEEITGLPFDSPLEKFEGRIQGAVS